jgi:hypothetical protein
MHGPIKFKSPNNTGKWQMRFNSAFKGLITGAGRITNARIGGFDSGHAQRLGLEASNDAVKDS